MDIVKADYKTVIKFGTLQNLKEKIRSEGKKPADIIGFVCNDGSSLLESSLSSRKFEISEYLLTNGAPVNIVSAKGYNELHFLAANIYCAGAVEIGYKLVNMGVELMQKDTVYGNTAIFTLCMEALKKRSDPQVNEFIVFCLKRISDLDDKNQAGISLRNLLAERGTQEMKDFLSTHDN